jgi:hypothetical protein
MNYIPKHAKPVSGREDKDGARHAFGLVETSAGRHVAPGGKPQQGRRAPAPQEKVAV